MSKLTEKISELAQPIVKEEGCSLWDVEYVREAGTRYLRIYIDKVGGVSIDDCERVSRSLDPILDPRDVNEECPVIATAIREIHEETGIVVDLSRDEVSVVNPLLFSTPGMTDESNALVKVVLKLDDLSVLSQEGAEGQECFDGFCLVTKEEALKILKDGVDANGHFYSVYTWAALMYFATDMWK